MRGSVCICRYTLFLPVFSHCVILLCSGCVWVSAFGQWRGATKPMTAQGQNFRKTLWPGHIAVSSLSYTAGLCVCWIHKSTQSRETYTREWSVPKLEMCLWNVISTFSTLSVMIPQGRENKLKHLPWISISKILHYSSMWDEKSGWYSPFFDDIVDI